MARRFYADRNSAVQAETKMIGQTDPDTKQVREVSFIYDNIATGAACGDDNYSGLVFIEAGGSDPLYTGEFTFHTQLQLAPKEV